MIEPFLFTRPKDFRWNKGRPGSIVGGDRRRYARTRHSEHEHSRTEVGVVDRLPEEREPRTPELLDPVVHGVEVLMFRHVKGRWSRPGVTK